MNRIQNRLNQQRFTVTQSQRRGNVIIMVCVGLVVMLGCAALAVDYGMSVSIKNKLQRSCDAAALAGASQLVTGALTQPYATAKAREVAASNGVTVNDSDVSFPSSTRIQVRSTQQRRFLFGAAIGVPTGSVSATALAGRSFITGMNGAVPLGITRLTYETYRASAVNPSPAVVDLVLTRNTQEKFGPLNGEPVVGNTVHNVVALDLRSDNSGNSGALFQNDLTSGSPVQVRTQTQIDPLGASVSSQGQKIVRAIQDRIDAAAAAPYNDPVVNRFGGSNYEFPNFPEGDPRVIWILVGNNGYEANNSNPKLDLTYFAKAYITGPVEFTKGSNPTAILPLRIMSTGELSSNNTNIIVSDDDNSYDTGAYAIRLLG